VSGTSEIICFDQPFSNIMLGSFRTQVLFLVINVQRLECVCTNKMTCCNKQHC